MRVYNINMYVSVYVLVRTYMLVYVYTYLCTYIYIYGILVLFQQHLILSQLLLVLKAFNVTEKKGAIWPKKDGLVIVHRILNHQIYIQVQDVLKFLYHLFD